MNRVEEKQTRILIFTGDGKGKTTAAVGMALRAVSHAMRVAIVQFVKAGKVSGEMEVCSKTNVIDFTRCGLGFIPSQESKEFEAHKERAEKGLGIAKEVLNSEKYEVVILDEICVAVDKELLCEYDVLNAIAGAKQGLVIVLTGRGATKRLIEMADTVTEMKCVKHGYQSNIKAQAGVEF